jgi:hypothetical protein
MGAHSASYILGPAWDGVGTSLEAAVAATVAIDAAKFFGVDIREFNTNGHQIAQLPKGRVEVIWYDEIDWPLTYIASETGRSLADEQGFTYEVRDESSLVVIYSKGNC